MLEEGDLEFDRMFEGMAVVFHRNGRSAFFFEAIDQIHSTSRRPVRRQIGFARQSKTIGLTVVRRAEDDEGAVAIFGREQTIGGLI